MSTPPPQKSSASRGASGERRSRSELMRGGGMIAIAVLITLFAVLNLREVKVDWILGSGHAPLIIVVVVSVLVGIVLTYLAERIHRRNRDNSR